MAAAGSELILAVIDPIVLFVAQVHQPVIATPAVGMDYAVGIHPSPDNALQRGFSAVRDDFGVDFAAAFEDPKYRSFLVSTAAASALDAFSAEVGLVNLDLSFEGRLGLTELGDPRPDKGQIPVDSIAVEVRQGGYRLGIQVMGKELD